MNNIVLFLTVQESKKSKNSSPVDDSIEISHSYKRNSPLASTIEHTSSFDTTLPKVVSVPLLGHEWLPVTGSDGRRVYVRLKGSDSDNCTSSFLTSVSNSYGQDISTTSRLLRLLSTPIGVLRDRAEEIVNL